MEQLKRLLLMAEDELTEYSTTARKIEKLRRKIGLSVSAAEQKQAKEALTAIMHSDWIRQLVEQQRQTVALPFWGIAGLGLLVGISFSEPLVVHHESYDREIGGYERWNFPLASVAAKRQSILAFCWLRCCCQAAISWRKVSVLGIRRSKH